MRLWLMKSEPSECSIDDLVRAPRTPVPWVGVRNYQARNFMRDEMAVGDQALFYHSSCPDPGVAGVVEIVSAAYPDATQFDPSSPYHDAKSSRSSPRWWLVDVRLVRKTRLIGLAQLRSMDPLKDMMILRRGNRLSITPVSPAEWAALAAVAQPA